MSAPIVPAPPLLWNSVADNSATLSPSFATVTIVDNTSGGPPVIDN